jgi:NADH:ubiquinone oxidoreductase subunit 3 (subunit A)
VPFAATPGSEPGFDLAAYYPIFLYLLAIFAFVGAALLAAQLIGPYRKTPVKMMPYESGMDPIGDARQHFDVKFYLTAILFLVFDVELLFLYPWAVSEYREEGPRIPEALRDPVFWEILVFMATLVVAYVYAWRKGVFKWR